MNSTGSTSRLANSRAMKTPVTDEPPSSRPEKATLQDRAGQLLEKEGAK